jgi:CheY-like chemotaxis protein/anti-sigma regulatory factor (Ser/Thr protein kinase)
MSRILVVDDDRITLHLVRGILTGEGFEVTTASHAEEASRLVAATPFDLIIVDVWMPGISGLDFLAQLRSRGPTPPALVLTADETPETVLRAIGEQAGRFLAKPVNSKALIDAVQATLEGPSPTRPIEVLSAKPDWVELLVPCEIHAGERIRNFLAQLDTGLPDEVRESVGAAFQELLRNAIEWGGRLDPESRVRIAYIRTPRMILYRIADPGQGFRFEELHHAAIANPEDQPLQHVEKREELGLRPGGYGLLMTRALVDELIFNEKQNEVVFVKYLEERPSGPERQGRS